MELKIEAHAKQRELIESPKKRIAAVAGIGGGKSYGGALKSLLTCIANPGIRILVTAPSYKMMMDATQKTYETVFNLVPGFAQFIHGDSPMGKTTNGCELIFRSTDKPDYLRGAEVGCIHMDEASGSPYYAYDVLQGRMRQMTKQGEFYPRQLWVTTTPKGLNWIYTEWVLNPSPEHHIIKWRTEENVFMPAEYASELRERYKGKFGAQELSGDFLNLEGECVFDQTVLTRILQTQCREPSSVEDNGITFIWKEPVLGNRYVAGGDCADEGGGGVNCLVIQDWQTGEEVAEIWGDIPSDTFTGLADKWGRVYNNALLGVERNGVGHTVIETLEKMKYPNLYKDEHDKAGFYTHSLNRTPLLETYRVAVHRGQTVIHNEAAIQEMMTFVVKASDKWEHLEGQMDDRIFARAICWKMRNCRQGQKQAWISVSRRESTYA